MKCEACGGDGLIEVGAYRGDDSSDTRTCQLCGGVVTLESRRETVESWQESVSGERVTRTTTFKDEQGQMRTLHEVGVSAEQAGRQLTKLAHATSESGVRLSRPWEPEKVSDVKFVPRAMAAKEVADEYAQRLNEQNEREQRNAERMRRQQTDALRMVRIRQLKLTVTCWHQKPDDDKSTLRHCRGIESQELTGSWVKFKPAEHYETVTHVKICAAQQSGACVIPLSSSRSVQFGDALQVVFTEPELETIISTFVK